jgi:hypothetical protein
VRQVLRVILAQPVHKVNKDLQDKLSKLITKVYKVFKASVVLRATLETKVMLEK